MSLSKKRKVWTSSTASGFCQGRDNLRKSVRIVGPWNRRKWHLSNYFTWIEELFEKVFLSLLNYSAMDFFLNFPFIFIFISHVDSWRLKERKHVKTSLMSYLTALMPIAEKIILLRLFLKFKFSILFRIIFTWLSIFKVKLFKVCRKNWDKKNKSKSCFVTLLICFILSQFDMPEKNCDLNLYFLNGKW